jgi:hypothetical protein
MLPNLSALRFAQPPRCRGCGPSVGKYYADRLLALASTDIEEERKNGPDWHSDAICAICKRPLAGPAEGEAALTQALEALIENESLETCNHMFHSACLAEWIDEGNDTCSTCSVPINQLVLDRYKYGYAVYYGGPKVRVEKRDGRVLYYEGKQGHERKVRVTFPRGVATWHVAVENYAGKKGEEYLVSAEGWGKQELKFYKGEKDKEHLVQVIMAGGIVYDYSGEKGKERLVRTATPDGDVYDFLGEQGEERMVRAIFRKEGTTIEYEGKKGEEVEVRRESASTKEAPPSEKE